MSDRANAEAMFIRLRKDVEAGGDIEAWRKKVTAYGERRHAEMTAELREVNEALEWLHHLEARRRLWPEQYPVRSKRARRPHKRSA